MVPIYIFFPLICSLNFSLVGSGGFRMVPIMYFLQLLGEESKENCTFKQCIKSDLTVRLKLVHSFCIFVKSRNILS